MVKCVVGSCKNTSNTIYKNKDGISLHRFPKDEARRRKWKKAVNCKIESDSAVCSEHFDVNHYFYTKSGLRKLTVDAVPRVGLRKLPSADAVSRNKTEPRQATKAEGLKLSVSLPVNIKSTDTEEVVKLKHRVRRLEVLAANRKKRLNLMWQSEKRLKNKLKVMEAVIHNLIRRGDKYRKLI